MSVGFDLGRLARVMIHEHMVPTTTGLLGNYPVVPPKQSGQRHSSKISWVLNALPACPIQNVSLWVGEGKVIPGHCWATPRGGIAPFLRNGLPWQQNSGDSSREREQSAPEGLD